MPQTGKTSMIGLLESALNKASNNELKIRCAQERKNKLRYLAENPPDHLQTSASQDATQMRKTNQQASKTSFEAAAGATKATSITGAGSTMDALPAPKAKAAAKKGSKSNEKNKNAWWQDLYKETRLEPHEIEA
jgi:hypothetical protein